MGYCATTSAAEDTSNLYLSAEIGMNSSSAVDFFGNSTDQGSVCDPYINPDPSSRTQAGCPSAGTQWLSPFDKTQGVVGGFVLGYDLAGGESSALEPIRLEFEYMYRTSDYDQTTSIRSRSGVARDKLDNEVYRAEERIGNITSHNFFGNLIYDVLRRNRYTTYVGIGIGMARTKVDNGRIWLRNHDWTQIQTGAGLPNAEEIRRNLAGTVSSLQTTDEATSNGFQALLGVDFELNDSMSVGVKSRWVQFESLTFDSTLDVLRSHPVPATYVNERELDPMRFLAVGVTVTYRL